MQNVNRTTSITLHVTIKDLNIKLDTLNLIEEKVGDNLECIGTEDNFLNTASIAQAVRTTISKQDPIKLKWFCKAKDTINRTNRQPTKCEKIFNNPTSNRALISKIYKELKKLDTNKPNNPIKIGVQS